MEPLESQLLHPPRRARDVAAHEAEADPQSQKPRARQAAAQIRDEQARLGKREADVDEARIGRPPPAVDLLQLTLVVLIAEWRAVRAGDVQTGGAPAQFVAGPLR